MYEIRRYVELSAPQRERLFAFTFEHDPERFADLTSMELAYRSAAFEHGTSQFSLWQGEALQGAMGAVVREAGLRGEVFVTAIALTPGHEAGFPLLLAKAFGCMPTLPGLVVKMGISPRHPHVEALARAQGFCPDYDGLVMTYTPGAFTPTRDAAWRVETVCEANRVDYRKVLDAAFRDSPNGATVDDEQIAELMAEIPSPDLLALGYWEERPVAAMELSLAGETGWIEALAVLPDCQGQGHGKRLLGDALARLEGHGVETIKLLVMSTNTPAVALYRRHGFGSEYVTTRWWRLAR